MLRRSERDGPARAGLTRDAHFAPRGRVGGGVRLVKLFRQDPGSDPREGRRAPRGPLPRRPTPTPPARPFRQLAFWVFVGLLALVAYRMYQGNFMATPRVEISYTRFIGEVDRGNIANLQIVEN